MFLRLCIIYFMIQSCSLQHIMKSLPFNVSFIKPRIIQGEKAKLGDVPYQVAFKQQVGRFGNTYATFCGGSLISNNKILSAAHCFDEALAWYECQCDFWSNVKKVKSSFLRKTYAVVGTLRNEDKYSLSSSAHEGQWSKLSNGVYPKDYKFPKADIAIITTHKTFSINNHVKPIPMATRHIEYHMPCLASGYGRLSHDNKNADKSPHLFWAYMDIIPTTYCNAMHRKNMIHFICSSSKIPDTAKGDSGGPLVCNRTGDPSDKGAGVLVGVVSGHRVGVGSFFTRVSSYQTFIQKYGDATRNYNSIICIFVTIYVTFCLF